MFYWAVQSNQTPHVHVNWNEVFLSVPGVHVPVVILVLEGGENTIKTAVEGIKRNTPVVVVQGSGRAADFIAYAYRESKSKEWVWQNTDTMAE